MLYYLYDETGSPRGMQYRTSSYASGTFDFYFFEKNLQGDIIGIYNSNGVKICTYKYDAWGNCSVSTASGISSLDKYVANIYNPFRYRGYYYDTQTGFYYLQSRYYNPGWGRFLNADACLYSSILGFNMFAYCDNNPVNYIDPYGESGFVAALAGWASSAWGLTLVDGPLPVGDIIYAAGCVILGGIAVVETIILAEEVVDIIQEATDTTPEPEAKPEGNSDGKDKPNDVDIPDVDYPGDDPTVAPGDDYEWRGQQPVGGEKGSWVNKSTGEQWHPDLNHPMPKGPHWDYTRIINGIKEVWSIFKDGRAIIWK